MQHITGVSASGHDGGHPTATCPALLPEALRAGVTQAGPSSGLVVDDTRLTLAQADRHATHLAQALIQSGVAPGDRVVIVLPSSAEFILVCFAVWKARAIAVPVDPAIRLPNLHHILRDTDPTALVLDHHMLMHLVEADVELARLKVIMLQSVSQELAGLSHLPIQSLAALLAHAPADPVRLPTGAHAREVVSITFTSGSTGIPKGVMHTHASWLAGAAFTRHHLQLTAADTSLIPLPVHHAYAFRHIVAHVLAGATVITTDNLYKALAQMQAVRPTALLLVPAACQILLERFPSLLQEADAYLRYIEIGTAAMSPERLERLRALLPTTHIHLSYGLTEARVGYLQPGTTGLLNRITNLASGLELWVQSGPGQPAAVGEPGEIVLRGAGLMQGYWGDSATEQQRLQTNGFATGDMGQINSNGHVELLGRIDDVLKIGGRKVIPLELELILNQHPAVLESAAVAVPDPRGVLEYQLHAFVVLKDGETATVEALATHCQYYLEPYKRPAAIHLRSSLPKSSVGKVQRRQLAEAYVRA